MHRIEKLRAAFLAGLMALVVLCSGCMVSSEQVDETKNGPIAQFIQAVLDVLDIPSDGPSSRDWELVLVNDTHRVPTGYPGTLVKLSNGQQVDERIYPSLQAMFHEARRQGYAPTVRSGYRSREAQQKVFDEKKRAFMAEGYSASEAEKKTLEWVARPGYSEHETGLAVDITPEKTSRNKDGLYRWLEQNSWRYGFICRYPPSKSSITHVAHEPWHYRYVGKEHAQAMYEQGLCLEEYLQQ